MEENIDGILKKPVQFLKGVGEARAKLFQKLGIFTVEDVLTHFPREYEDRRRLKKAAEMQDNDTCAFEGVVRSKVEVTKPRKDLSIYKLSIGDDTGIITAVWFNQHYIKNVFAPGERYVFYGRISKRFNRLEMQNPVYEKIEEGEMKDACRIVPIYPSTHQLSQNILRSVIGSAVKAVEGSLEEILPQWIRSRYKLSGVNYSLRNIHFPQSEEDFKKARFRLAFEELLLLQLGLLSIKRASEETKSGICFKTVDEMAAFMDNLPFQLTDAQRKVFAEIERDMEKPVVMNRLVQGDVGSGKTVVAVLALYKAVKSGFQGTLMVPTEILAEQHFSSISRLLEGSGIKTALLTGSRTGRQKDLLLEEISEGRIDIVIGTHALVQEKVKFKNLGLVVTDEQHRFGVRQRAALSRKGDSPDVLVMTATPIPRTLALILYGDLDISVIDQLPPGRKPVMTYAVDESMRDRVNGFVRKKVSEGRQVYIVCPLVEESDTVEAKSAMELADRIAGQDFKDLKVGLIHGKMKSRDKDEIMKSFVEGRISILVSTTVIEVGVDVPNATLMIIENAERFGLAQLHQLRGRVGRGEHQSYCILYNQGKTRISRERMKIMEKTGDGFLIAEKDLELRGPGEFFGTRQHGLPDLKIANLYKDLDILKMAQEAALELIKNDRFLKKEENAGLKKRIAEKFREKINGLSLN
ncbi:MAG: ATP-dependent DNA helicase RecG [Clostridiales bacterium]|jgi:ATP-dependent DNA helicase RecG|nr:ATP-dependent DNA helicase RecG [Eubacteriales bacterium]MDH7565269.1 ATP-dependent DNA helicase RecG [Clostridiales bacterium]